MNIDYFEFARGIISVEIRGIIFFALALAVVFFLRKRSARVVATCWRSLFAAATVMIVLGFAKPMLVVELLGARDTPRNEETAAIAMPDVTPVKSPVGKAHNDQKLALSPEVGNPQLPTASVSDEGSQISWIVLTLVVWIMGMIVFLIRPLTGLVGLASLYRQSGSANGLLMEKFRLSCQRARVSCLKLRQLQAVDGVPFVAGVFRPTLFVPTSARDWGDSDWEIILKHEAAHVRHFDGFFNLLSQLCLAVYWANPLVWVAYRQLKISQECAADDAVLSDGISAGEYARALLKFCKQTVTVPTMAMPMARPSTMRVRIKRILDTRCRRTADQAESRIGGFVIIVLATILGTTALVRAEKAVNQAFAMWALEHFVEAFIESQADAKADPRIGHLIIGQDTDGRRYNRWDGKLSLSWLEGMLENDLYLSGPHKKGKLNLESKTSFGHYNPVALDEVALVLKRVLAEESFVEAFQPAYDKYLRKPTRIYIDVFKKQHRKIDEDPEAFEALSADYQAWITGGQVGEFEPSLGKEFNNSIADTISNFQVNAKKNGAVDWYEATFASRFWTRRRLDGTDEKFLEILAMVMTVMDPGGPLPKYPKELVVESDATPLKNGLSIDLKKANLRANQLVAWSRIDGGAWVKGSSRNQLLEGTYNVEWQYRLAELPVIRSQTQKAKLKIGGSLRPLINQAFTELASEKFVVRSKAQNFLANLDVQAISFLESLVEKSTDVEQRLRLEQAIKTIAGLNR